MIPSGEVNGWDAYWCATAGLDELRRDTDTDPYGQCTLVQGRALLREYERGRPDGSPWTLPGVAAPMGMTIETVRALLDRARRDLEAQ